MKVVSTTEAPSAIGPYVQAIKAGNFVYLSGQLGLDPKTMAFPGSDVESQTKQSFENIKHILAAEKLSLKNVCKVTVFLEDIKDFDAVNAIYATYFNEHKPARSAVQVAKLPKSGKVEIEVIAYCE